MLRIPGPAEAAASQTSRFRQRIQIFWIFVVFELCTLFNTPLSAAPQSSLCRKILGSNPEILGSKPRDTGIEPRDTAWVLRGSLGIVAWLTGAGGAALLIVGV
jgi:hypothetical protein